MPPASLRLIPILVIACLLQKAHGNDSACGTVRMDKPPGAVSSMPMFNQGRSTGLCYAAAATQVGDAYLASNGRRDEFISIAHAAALYNGKMQLPDAYKFLSEKYGEDSWVYAQFKKGVESQNFDAEDPRALDADFDSGEATSTIKALRNNKWACAMSREGYDDAQIETTLRPFLELRRDILRRGDTQDFSERFGCAAEFAFPPQLLRQLGDLKEIADRIVKTLPDKGEYMLSVIENTCPKKINLAQLPEPKNVVFGEKDMRNGDLSTHQIQNLLSQPRPLPIALRYEGSSLFKKSPKFPHWEIVVGREVIDGVCQIIIRDSYGPSCQGPSGAGEYISLRKGANLCTSRRV